MATRSIDDLIGLKSQDRPAWPQGRPVGHDSTPAGTLPPLVTTEALAGLLGLTVQHAHLLARNGTMVRPARNTFDLAASVQNYIASIKGRGTGITGERERLTRLQADTAELKLAEARRELVPAGEIEAAWATIVRDARAALLAVAPRVGQRLGNLTPGDVAVIDAEIREALTRLGGDSDDDS